MKLQNVIHTLNLIAILLAGSMSTPASASEPGTVCIQRATAEACRQSIEDFEALEAEARKVRVQRDEAQGARNELRMLYFDTLAESTDWQIKAKAAQEVADNAPSRLVWFGAGAAAGVVTTAVVFVLVR